MKVLYLTNIPSPYRVDYFNELGKQCDLTVLFETSSSTERNKCWQNYQFIHFKGIVMKGIRISRDGAFCPAVIKYLKKGKYDYIISTILASPTGLLAAAWLKWKRIKYCYEGDGGFAGKPSGIKASLKRFILASADICFSTSRKFDEYCITYGASKEKIQRYPFSSMHQKDILPTVPCEEEKQKKKKQLAIQEKRIILSVGRIIHLKGFDILLNAFADTDSDWGLYIIGGEINKEFENIIKLRNIMNVHFITFKSSEVLRQYYIAADLFVLPTRYDPWGLVINEAMAHGLPVISTYSCGAGIEMIREGENGYLYKPEEIQALKIYLTELMKSPGKRASMGEKGLATARQYTIEKMAEAHYFVLKEKINHGK